MTTQSVRKASVPKNNDRKGQVNYFHKNFSNWHKARHAEETLGINILFYYEVVVDEMKYESLKVFLSNLCKAKNPVLGSLTHQKHCICNHRARSNV